MNYTDNVNIGIGPIIGRKGQLKLKMFRSWLDERKIKYNFVYQPVWDIEPSYINMRNEDAIAFRLTFGL